MPKSQGQKQKLLYLIKILHEQTDEEHPMTLKKIMQELSKYGINAERKSLYDDFETLSTFGYDVHGIRGKTTGYYLGERDFELPELEMLLDAVQASRFITNDKSLTLISKLEHLASCYQADKLHRGIHIDERIKSRNSKTYFAISDIHNGISEDKKIAFHYFKWNINKEKEYRHDKKLYTVSPFALIWDDEKYYLVAYDSQDRMIKNYRVDKMENTCCTDERREGYDDFREIDLATYTNSHFGMFGGEMETVTLKCENSMADIILDRFGHDTMLFKNTDGTFNVNVRVHVSPIFIAWLFNFGKRVKVISPAGVIAEVKKAAESVREMYK
ncbi:MAG: WYL domain-containing protein [Clostridia bacterium]|nr:WYL domain-containing protein [Clostridia bacterium]